MLSRGKRRTGKILFDYIILILICLLVICMVPRKRSYAAKDRMMYQYLSSTIILYIRIRICPQLPLDIFFQRFLVYYAIIIIN